MRCEYYGCLGSLVESDFLTEERFSCGFNECQRSNSRGWREGKFFSLPKCLGVTECSFKRQGWPWIVHLCSFVQSAPDSMNGGESRDRKPFTPLQIQTIWIQPLIAHSSQSHETQSHLSKRILVESRIVEETKQESKSHLHAASEWCEGPRSWCGAAADQAGGRRKVRVPHCPHCPPRVPHCWQCPPRVEHCPLTVAHCLPRVPLHCPPSSLLLLRVADLIVAWLKVRQSDRCPKVEPSCSHEDPSCCCSQIPSWASLPSTPWWCSCLGSFRAPPRVEHCGEHGGEWGEQGGGIVATVSKLWDSWHPDMSSLKRSRLWQSTTSF